MARRSGGMTLTFLLHMTKQDFLDRYVGNVLGALWTVAVPLSQIIIFTVIFGNIIGARLPGNTTAYGYGIYLVSGLLPWVAFAATVQRGMNSFQDRKPILTKVYMPLPLVAAPIAISEGLTLVIGLGLLTAFLAWTGSGPGVPDTLWLAVPLIVMQQVLGLALGLLAGALIMFLRDVREITNIALQLWFWATPIVYVPGILPQWAQEVMVYNPALLFIGPFHAIFGGQAIPWWQVQGLGLVTLVAAGLAWGFLRLTERHIRDMI